MDRFYLYSSKKNKQQSYLEFDLKEGKKCWLLPSSASSGNGSKKLAFELPQLTDYPGRTVVDEGELFIKRSGKRKIIFSLKGENLMNGDFILLVPSWGLRTEKKIWLLIPVSKK